MCEFVPVVAHCVYQCLNRKQNYLIDKRKTLFSPHLCAAAAANYIKEPIKSTLIDTLFVDISFVRNSEWMWCEIGRKKLGKVPT